MQYFRFFCLFVFLSVLSQVVGRKVISRVRFIYFLYIYDIFTIQYLTLGVREEKFEDISLDRVVRKTSRRLHLRVTRGSPNIFRDRKERTQLQKNRGYYPGRAQPHRRTFFFACSPARQEIKPSPSKQLLER